MIIVKEKTRMNEGYLNVNDGKHQAAAFKLGVKVPSASSLLPLFSKIAKTDSEIPTLQARNRDDLDFHDLAVWSISGLMYAAYCQGAIAGKLGKL